MKRWPTKPFLSVCDFQGGTQPPKSTFAYKPTNGFLRLIQIRDFESDDDLTFVPSTTKLKTCDESDVMIARYGASLGRILRGKAGAYNVALVKTLPDESQLMKGFLYHWLSSPFFQSYLAKVANRAAQAGFNKEDLTQLEMPVPPLSEQQRIVKLLDEADELRKLRGQTNRRTVALIPALFHEMFGDPEANSKGWPRGQLKDFGAEVRYGLGQPPEEDPQGVPILRATNVKRGCISEIGLIRVRREAVPATRNAFLNADDVLVVRSGAYTGDIARVGERWAGSVAGYDLVVSPKERLAGDFIAWFFLSDFVQDRYFKGLKLRAAQPHLNSTQVAETPFFCPPLALQKAFAQRVTEIRELEAYQTTSRTRLDALFQSMLHRAFSGQL